MARNTNISDISDKEISVVIKHIALIWIKVYDRVTTALAMHESFYWARLVLESTNTICGVAG